MTAHTTVLPDGTPIVIVLDRTEPGLPPSLHAVLRTPGEKALVVKWGTTPTPGRGQWTAEEEPAERTPAYGTPHHRGQTLGECLDAVRPTMHPGRRRALEELLAFPASLLAVLEVMSS